MKLIKNFLTSILLTLTLTSSLKADDSSGLSYDKYVPKIEYRKGARADDERARDCINEFEKVPDKVQRFLVDRGGKIIFFDGSLTDNAEFADQKGVRPKGYRKENLWDNAIAGYSFKTKTICIGIKGDYASMENPLLHEYGHAFDHLMGNYFYGKQLSKIPSFLEIIKSQPFQRKYFNIPTEYIANSFELYYGGVDGRNELKKNHFEIFKKLSDIELKVLSLQYESKTQKLNSGTKKRFFRRRY